MHEGRKILQTLPQRRKLDAEHIDAPEQVLAKLARGHEAREVSMGGRDDAQINLDRARTSDSLDLAFLQRPQEFHLLRQRKLGHLVEKQSAAVRPFESSLVRTRRAGERALFVAKQIALDQVLRQRTTVYRDERAAPPRRARVESSGEELLAGPRLAAQQHRGVVNRHQVDPRPRGPHRGTAGDDVRTTRQHLDFGTQSTTLLVHLPRACRETLDHRALHDHQLQEPGDRAPRYGRRARRFKIENGDAALGQARERNHDDATGAQLLRLCVRGHGDR